MDNRQIKIDCLTMSYNAKESHIGSCLSCIDILSILYNDVLIQDRDILIFSKGHAAAALYATLNNLTNYPINIDDYGTEKLPSEASHKVPGIEFSTGSLGHGLSIGCGMAIADRNRQVYVLTGDGELNEGSCWEAMAFAAAYQLSNLTLIVDNNIQQGMGKDILKINPLKKKINAFGFYVVETDGHNHPKLRTAFKDPFLRIVPKAIIANTIKGKGVSFMEDDYLWHYKSLTEKEFKSALKEIS